MTNSSVHLDTREMEGGRKFKGAQTWFDLSIQEA